MQRISLDEVILLVLGVSSCHNILLIKKQTENKSRFKCFPSYVSNFHEYYLTVRAEHFRIYHPPFYFTFL